MSEQKLPPWKIEWTIAHAITGATVYTVDDIDVSAAHYIEPDQDALRHMPGADDLGEAVFEIARAMARNVMTELGIEEGRNLKSEKAQLVEALEARVRELEGHVRALLPHAEYSEAMDLDEKWNKIDAAKCALLPQPGGQSDG